MYHKNSTPHEWTYTGILWINIISNCLTNFLKCFLKIITIYQNNLMYGFNKIRFIELILTISPMNKEVA